MLVLDGETFEVVDEFIYLGTLVTCDNEVRREIKRQIAAAQGLLRIAKPAEVPPSVNPY